jgi:membrane-associated phospholipid phosphatase
VNSENVHKRAARLLADVLNPFFIFTVLYALVALSEASALQAALYISAELAAAVFVAGYVFVLRLRRRVGDFWISTRAERIMPALVLLGAFVALSGTLVLLEAPETLLRTTLSIGSTSATVAATTLLWKVSAHSAVAGHAAVASLLVFGLPGLLFATVLALVLWSRVAPGAHTLSQALTGAGVGAAFALLFMA